MIDSRGPEDWRAPQGQPCALERRIELLEGSNGYLARKVLELEQTARVQADGGVLASARARGSRRAEFATRLDASTETDAMLTNETENYARVRAETTQLERYFPLHHQGVTSLRITAENDHLDQPAFFVVVGLAVPGDWKQTFSIEVALTQALKTIDPFRTVYIAFSSIHGDR